MIAPEDAWIDALAGRAAANTAEAEVREGRALRAQILAQRAANESVVAIPDAAREAALVARARADGLMTSLGPSPTAASRIATQRWRRVGGIAAAAVVVLALAVTLTWHPLPPPETVRGIESGTVHLETPDPQLLKRQLIVELTAAGVTVSGYEKLGSVGIDADLPQPLPPAVLKVLEQHHIPVPADGVLVVEITATAGR